MSASSMPQTIDLTGNDGEGAGSPSRQASPPFAHAPKREASAADEDEAPPHKRTRTRTRTPAASPADQPADTTAVATASNEAQGMDRNITRKSALDNMKQRAPRYLTTWSSEEGVDFKNPDKFCIKPTFYIRWQPHDYINLAEHIRYQFDPIPFARAADKPVEEVNLIAARLIFNPLYDASEAMKRDEEGRKEVFAAFKKNATPSRPWANRTINGELDGVKTGGELRVVCEDVSLEEVGVDQLDVTDTKYLDSTLTKGDWILFYGKSEKAYDEMMGKNEDAKNGNRAKSNDDAKNDNDETDEDQADDEEKKNDDEAKKDDEAKNDDEDEKKKDASKNAKGKEKGKEAQTEKHEIQARSDEASKKRKRDV